MTRNLLRAGALSCALLTSTALCTQPAMAQTTSAAREHRALDANGVDLTHGDFVMSITEGSIGSGDAELALVRTGIAYGAGFTNNGHQWDQIRLEQSSQSGGGIVYTVTLGTRQERFTGAGTLPSGSTLSGGGGGVVYRAPDGTQIAFTDPAGSNGSSSPFCNGDPAQTNCTLLPSTIASPDGKVVSLEWDIWTRCEGIIEEGSENCTHEARLARVYNSYGYEIRFTYAANGGGGGSTYPGAAWFRRTGATFHNNNVSGAPAQGSTSYAYPASSVVQVTDMAGRVWRITGSFNAVTGIRRPGAAADTTTISYANGVVSSVTRDGVTTNYARSVSGNNVTMTATNALNQSVSVVTDVTIGRPKEVTDGLGRKTQYQYDTHGRLTRVTAPEGNYVHYTYDARGNVTETRSVGKAGSGVADIVTTASYDATCAPGSGSGAGNLLTCNSPNSVTDARGNVTEFTYDATHGGVLTVTAPAPTSGATRPQTRYAYTLTNGEYRLTAISACASGSAPGCVGTAAESRTVIGYDATGNVTSVTQRDGTGALSSVGTATYNAMGDILTMDGPLAGTGDTTRLRYNGAREVIGTISADPDGAGPLKHRATRNIIDAATGLLTRTDIGTVNSQSDADWLNMAVHQSMEAEYDGNARPTVQRLTAGGATYSLAQVSYDALGRPECQAVRMNPAAFGSVPSSACTLGTEGTFGPDRISKAVYDAAGQVTQTLSAVGTPDQAVEAAATYRNNGQVETLTDGENNRTTYVYDGHDRLKQTRYPVATRGANASSTTDYEELTYDAGGNVTSVRLRDGQSIGMSYDALNRPTQKDLPGGELDVLYQHDLLGRTTQASNAWGYVQMTHDALGRLTRERSASGGWFDMEYDTAGRMTKVTHPWGDFPVTYDYLVTGEVSRIREYGATSGIGVVASYGYDDLGRRTSETRGNGTGTSYGYDAVGRLGSMGHDMAGTTHDLSVTFGYSPAGQIVSRTGSNDAYAVSSLANQNVTDSHNGLNQVTASASTAVTHDAKGNTSGIGSTAYTYDSENKMTGAGGTALHYDPLGRLASIAGSRAGADYVGDRLMVERNSGGLPDRHFVQAPGEEAPAVWYEGYAGSTNRRFLHKDERGSVIAVSDNSGNVTAVNRYDDYGKPDGAVTGRFGYTGQQWLPEIGLSYYKARMYNPDMARGGGRFMQTDPIGYGDGPNVYMYVSGDPMNRSDPSGTCAIICDVRRAQEERVLKKIREILKEYAGSFHIDPEAGESATKDEAAKKWEKIWRNVVDRLLGDNEELVSRIYQLENGKFTFEVARIVTLITLRNGDLIPFNLRELPDSPRGVIRVSLIHSHSHSNPNGFSPADYAYAGASRGGSFLVEKNGGLWFLPPGVKFPYSYEGGYLSARRICIRFCRQ